jgi:hypothetical protein
LTGNARLVDVAGCWFPFGFAGLLLLLPATVLMTPSGETERTQ